MAKTKWLLVGLVVITVTALALFYVFEWSKRVAPGSPKAAEIEAAIVYGYNIRIAALHNGGDVSEFDQAYIDTPDFRLENEEDKAFVERVLGPEAAASAGYLSAMKAMYKARGCGVKLLEEAGVQALQENRHITGDEYQAIANQCYGERPGSVLKGAPDPEVTFLKIKMDGDRATAVYSYGPSTEKATLVRKDGHWLISVIETLKREN